MSSYFDRLQRRAQEHGVKELRDQGRLHEVKGISPEMDKRVDNALRRLRRKEGKG